MKQTSQWTWLSLAACLGVTVAACTSGEINPQPLPPRDPGTVTSPEDGQKSSDDPPTSDTASGASSSGGTSGGSSGSNAAEDAGAQDGSTDGARDQ